MASAEKDTANDVDCSVITSSVEQNKEEGKEISGHDEKSIEMKEETANNTEYFDIYFVIDTTASMRNYIDSLHSVLQQLFSMTKILFANKCHLHIISYTDYCDKTGRMIQECHSNNNDDLLSFVETKLKASGGSDYPEAAKTALNVLYQNIMDNTDKNGKNINNISDNIIVFVYTDASPHHKAMGSSESNYTKELTYLANSEPGFDWIKICMSFRHLKMKRNKNIDFYTIMDENVQDACKQFWKLLGNVIEIPDKSDKTIAQATIGIISQLMGNKNEKEYEFAHNFKVLKYNPTHKYQSINNNNSNNNNDNNSETEMDFNEMINNYKEFEAFSLKYNENDCMGMLPWQGGKHIRHDKTLLLKENFLSLKPLSYMNIDLKKLPSKILNDNNFRDLVFYEFESNIFTIENIVCLSYNDVFGKLWRYLCKLREDDRLKGLKDKFGTILSKLSPNDSEIMKDWKQVSYDDTEEINNIILNHLKQVSKKENDANNNNKNNNNNNKNSDNNDKNMNDTNEQNEGKDGMMVEYIILDKVDRSKFPNQKEILTLTNGINKEIIGQMQRILTHLMIYQKNIKEGPPIEAASSPNTNEMNENKEVYDGDTDTSDISDLYITGIPYSLSDETIFSLLSHLVVKGTKFSLKSSLIMAMISYLSQNKMLCDRAKNLLKKYKGKWILLDKLDVFSEFLAMAFIHLAIGCDAQMRKNEQNEEKQNEKNEKDFGILTEKERSLFKNLLQINRIRSLRNEKFEIEIGFEKITKSKEYDLKRDFKRQCCICNEYRSFTNMLSNDICGLCFQIKHNPNEFIKKTDIKGNDYLGIPFGGFSADSEIYDENELINSHGEQIASNKVNAYSYITRCSVCNVNYAVSEIKSFQNYVLKPLCFDCRNDLTMSKSAKHCCENENNEATFKLTCVQCSQQWMCPNANFFKNVNGWIGPCCANFQNNENFIKQDTLNNNKKKTKRISVYFDDLLTQYPIIILPIFLNLSIDGYHNLMNGRKLIQFKNDILGSISLYKLYMKYKDTYLSHLTEKSIKWTDDIHSDNQTADETDMKEMENDTVETGISGLMNNNDKNNNKDESIIDSLIAKMVKDGMYSNHKLIHNIKQLILNIDNKINHGIGKVKDMCYLCFENKALNLLDSACGNCNNLMCIDCLHSWYNQCKAGKIILATHLLCPFCKNKPKVNTLKKYNKNICNIVQFDKNLANKLATNYNEYYFGWCIKCYQIKTAFERHCGDAANINDMINDIDNFTCANCKEREILAAQGKWISEIKKCPQCDAPTQLVDGCNHITCPCGCHWCYKCGKEFDADTIYDHMSQEHGGYWN